MHFFSQPLNLFKVQPSFRFEYLASLIALPLQGSMNFDSCSFLTEKLKLSPLAGRQVQSWPGIFYPFLTPLLLLTFMGGAPSPLIQPLNSHTRCFYFVL